MLVDVVTEFAAEVLRPAAAEADDACAAPEAVLKAGLEIGLPVLGVPESLGGISEERSAMAGTLVAEALAHGDLGLAVATLAPGLRRHRDSALWGTEEQQQTYLPEFTGDDVPAAAAGPDRAEPCSSTCSRPSTTARRDGDDLVLDGVKSLVAARRRRRALRGGGAARRRPRAGPRRERQPTGLGVARRPGDGRARRRLWRRLTLDGVRVPATAVLGATDGSTYAECVRLSRLAWCALAVGTGQAVLDYVTPYVKERQAFGEPIAHRQSVAFMVADIAIELQAMRLLTYKAASRAARGEDFAREVALARPAVREQGHADRPRRRPAPRRPRLRQGAPGRAVVPRPAGRRRHGRRGAGLMINLETPKKHRVLVDQAHQVAMNMLRPISRKYDRAEHAYPKELDMLAAMIDGLSEAGRQRGRRRRRRTTRRGRRRRRRGAQRRQPRVGAVRSPRCAGATPGCCCRMPRQGLGNSAIASVADEEQAERFAGLWAAMAITEPGTGSDSANITTTAMLDGDEYVLNGEKIYVTSGERADAVVVWATLDKSLGRAAIKSFVVPQGHAGHDGRAARAQARHPRLRHRDDPLRPTAGCRPRTCSARPRSTPSRASPARWRPSTTPGRWSPRWPSAAPARRST